MPQSKKKISKEVLPYEKLALIYDRVMDHVDYKFWNKYIRNLFRFANTRVHSILDLSCGTGNMLKQFNSSQWTTCGCDLSAPMVFQASQKKELQKTCLFISDAAFVPIQSASFQAILFLYDSINYITEKHTVQNIVNEANRLLTAGGIFVFDAVTRYQCRKYFRNYYENEFWGNTGYYRHSYFNSMHSEQRNDFEIHIDDQIFEEHHRQYIYETAEIQEIVEKAGLRICAALQNFSMQEAGRRAERIHYVCIKPGR